MKKCMRNNQNNGFTLVEVLATVGILVILLAVTAVSVARHINVLKIAEMDNAAREIYMAAENRAVLLHDAQRLDILVKGEGEGQKTTLNGNGHVGDPDETSQVALLASGDGVDPDKKESLYYVYSTADAQICEELLTTGSIDPTLLDNGDFYIVYDLVSGSVTDVFYAEKTDDNPQPLETILKKYGGDFSAFYADWAKGRSARLDLRDNEQNPNKTLVGWYNGVAAGGSPFREIIEVAPYLNVEIINGEKLTVKVTVQGDYVQELEKGAKLNVQLFPAGGESVLAYAGNTLAASDDTGAIGINYGGVESKGDLNKDGATDTIVCTWILDSLTPKEKSGDSPQEHKFSASFGEIITPGSNFTVQATITKGDKELASAADTDNSLFWKDKTGATDYDSGDGEGTAYIKYLRHLQNLTTEGKHASGVTGMTQAQQVGDILGDNNEVYKEYLFSPIVNEKLTKYTVDEKAGGNYYAIRNLTLDVNGNADVADIAGIVGLFANTNTADADGMTLQHIRMVNTKVSGDGAQSVGALVGQTSSNTTTIDDCWVYWEVDRGMTSLKRLVEDSANDKYNYQLRGQTVGGLVGVVNGKTEIKNSLAATLIEGTVSAGGLVGQWNGDDAAPSISYSYADCYLTGSGNVAGLIGEVAQNYTVTLQDCYAAGFILGGNNVAGLCAGKGTTEAHNVYTVMLYPGLKATPNYLTENHKGDTLVDVHFLAGSGIIDAKNGDGDTYQIRNSSLKEMTSHGTDEGTVDFADTMGVNFAWKSASDTHAYELRAELNDTYAYPGLKDLPHYGDWGDVLVTPTLVYYEEYADGSYRVAAPNIHDPLDDSKVIVEDGYALLFQGNPGDQATIKYTVKYVKNGELVGVDEFVERSYIGNLLDNLITVTSTDPDNPNATITEQLCLLILPEEVVNNKTFASEYFYQYLEVELTYGQTVSRQFIFNPHFASGVSSANTGDEDWTEDEILEKIMTPENQSSEEGKTFVSVRTPRHLYFLSVYPEYYNKENYIFSQGLDLDYSKYTGYDGAFLGAPFTGQEPIGGSESMPFLGTYDGDYHTITNVVPGTNLAKRDDEGDAWYWGLFGYSDGTLQNIVYQLNPDKLVAASLGDKIQNTPQEFWNPADKYVGVLAGGNGGNGVISNCAVWGTNMMVSVNSTEKEKAFIGGLVGQNLGIIEKCEAEFAHLNVNYLGGVDGFTGGLVGINGKWEDTNTNTLANDPDAEEAPSTIEYSYAVGFIEAAGDSLTEFARICGFAGYNSGTINSSYAAAYLFPARGKVYTYGFSGEARGNQNDTFYLNSGNYTYRKSSFGINYDTSTKATATDYGHLLTGDAASEGDPYTITNSENPFYGTNGGNEKKVWQRVNVSTPETGKTEDDVDAYPYPASVRDADGYPIHYGSWLGKLPLGAMGVFYWEELSIRDSSGSTKTQYYIYAVAVDPTTGEIAKRNTLMEAHDDGSAVTAYGYGYYYKDDEDGEALSTVDFSTNHINFATYDKGGVSGTPFNADSMKTVKDHVKETAIKPISNEAATAILEDENSTLTDYQRISEIFCGGEDGVNAKLAAQMEGFTFWAWPCFHEGGRPAEIYSDGDFRTVQSTSGLTPDTVIPTETINGVASGSKYGGAGWQGGYSNIYGNALPLMANQNQSRGTFTLTQKDGDKTVEVTYVVNTHFAASISVDSVKVTENAVQSDKKADWTNGSRSLTDDPGSSSYNPYQIRCGLQLQNINTFGGGNCASPVGLANANLFIYLTNDSKTKDYGYTGELYWVQTHDIDMTAEGCYYYVCDGSNGCEGKKYGVFVAIEDVGQHTKCNLTKEPGVFYSIAANHLVGNYNEELFALTEEGRLAGYFAGDYDGQNYVMKNMKIVTVWEQRYQYDVNCVGLFGAVKNGHLKDIVLYAEEQNTASSLYIMGQRVQNVVQSEWTAPTSRPGSASLEFGKFAAADFPACPGWYAGGVLAGVALNTEIEGCAVAGYTIYDMTQVAGGQETATGKNGTYQTSNGLGGAVGGLVGLTDSKLEGCTAVVNIVLQDSLTTVTETGDDRGKLNSDGHYNHSRLDNVTGYNPGPIRVGGLVGSTTSTVSNCYTGGSITVMDTSKSANLFAGRIIGGTGLEPLTSNPSNGVTISDCYSYMELSGVADGKEANKLSTAVYLIGGSEKNTEADFVTLENNYYLTDTHKDSNLREEGYKADDEYAAKSLTFAQLAGNAPIDGEGDVAYTTVNGKKVYSNNIYAKLNWYNAETGRYDHLLDTDRDVNGQFDDPYFTPVTDVVGGLAASGRFSYVPKATGGDSVSLQGYDYPFPTVLIQHRNDVDNGIAYVHYGEWPASIIRAYGNRTLSLNPFDADSWEEMEKLLIADGISKDGTWSVTVDDPDGLGAPVAVSFVTATDLETLTDADRVGILGANPATSTTSADGTVYLYIAALRECAQPVTVTVRYKVDEGLVTENEYTLSIAVNVVGDGTVIQSTPENLTVFALEEAEALRRGEADLTLGSYALRYMKGVWSVDESDYFAAGYVTGDDNVEETLTNGDNADALGEAKLSVAANVDDETLAKLIGTTQQVTVRYTVYGQDENGEENVLYTYDQKIDVTITDSVIQFYNGDLNKSNGIFELGDVFSISANGPMFKWGSLKLNDLFRPGDASGTWRVTWTADGVEKSAVFGEVYLSNSDGHDTERSNTRAINVGINVNTDITDVIDDTSHDVDALKDTMIVTVTYTSLDGIVCKKEIPVNITANVTLSIEGGSDTGYSLKGTLPETLTLKATNTKDEALGLSIESATVTDANGNPVDGLTAEVNEDQTITLSGTWPENTAELKLEVTYAADRNGYIKTGTETFEITNPAAAITSSADSVSLDVFDANSYDAKNVATLTLADTSVGTNGTWSVSTDNDAVTASLSGTTGTSVNLSLKVEKRSGQAMAVDAKPTVTVTVTYTVNGKEYARNITVELYASNVRMAAGNGKDGLTISQVNATTGAVTFNVGATLSLYPRRAAPETAWENLYGDAGTYYWYINGANNGTTGGNVDTTVKDVRATVIGSTVLTADGKDNGGSATVSLTLHGALNPETVKLQVTYIITSWGYSKEYTDLIDITVNNTFTAAALLDGPAIDPDPSALPPAAPEIPGAQDADLEPGADLPEIPPQEDAEKPKDPDEEEPNPEDTEAKNV